MAGRREIAEQVGSEQVVDRLGATGAWLATVALTSAEESVAAAAEIERLGYGALWFGETATGKEAFTNASLLLQATSTIVVATGIASVWARDPRAAHRAATVLGEAHPGRFLLGLGVSHAPLVQHRGRDYRRPLAMMRAYLDGIEESAEAFEGTPADPPVPIVLAALRPKMIELARLRAAGIHPYLVTPEHTARARAALGEEPLLAPEQTVVIEADPIRARAIARKFLSRYLALPNYTCNWVELGYEEADFADGGSDRLIDGLIAWGDAGQVAARVREHHEAGADHVCVQPLPWALAEQLRQLRELAPLLID